MSLVEQRTNVKFCVLLEKSPSETVSFLNKAYGDTAMKKSQVFEWHKRFREGRVSVDDDKRSGRPPTAINNENIERVRNIVRADRRLSVKKIASEVGISVGSCHSILLNELHMHRVCQHMVPKMLSPEQKETRMTLAGDLLTMADQDSNFLNNIITGDETWCFLYDPQTKRQSSEWKSPSSPRTQKFRLDKSKGKVMLEVFF
jgi:ribosomal protein S25